MGNVRHMARAAPRRRPSSFPTMLDTSLTLPPPVMPLVLGTLAVFVLATGVWMVWWTLYNIAPTATILGSFALVFYGLIKSFARFFRKV